MEEQPIEVEKGEASEAQIEEVKEGHFYRIKEVASDLGYSVAWITCLVQKGRIKGMKPLGGSWRIPSSEVARLKKEGIPPLPRTPPPLSGIGEIVVGEEHRDKVMPKKEEERKEKKKAGWPLDVFLK